MARDEDFTKAPKKQILNFMPLNWNQNTVQDQSIVCRELPLVARKNPYVKLSSFSKIVGNFIALKLKIA